MTPDIRPTPQPRAVIAISDDESRNKPTRVARCDCGWNAAVSATDALRAQAELHRLMEAHRRTCRRRVLES